jgi:hypothetical protein
MATSSYDQQDEPLTYYPRQSRKRGRPGKTTTGANRAENGRPSAAQFGPHAAEIHKRGNIVAAPMTFRR